MASIRMSGADRLTWLQGQVTNDVFASSCFCLCAPNGQIEGVFTMRAEGESHVLESTVSGCDALLRRVAEYVILEDVVAEGLNSSPCCLSPSPRDGEVAPRSGDGGGKPGVPPSPTASGLPPLGGEDLPQLLKEGDAQAKQEQGAGFSGIDPTPSDPSGGTFPSQEGKARFSRRQAANGECGNGEKVPCESKGDEVDSGEQAFPLTLALSPLGGEGALSFDSLAAGEIDPRFDIPPGTVPADLGERFFNAHVSLAKGCYTGQEVIHRMHARGAGKKTWAVLELSEPPKDPSAFTRWATDGTRILAGAFVPKEKASIGEEVSIGGTTARIVMLG